VLFIKPEQDTKKVSWVIESQTLSSITISRTIYFDWITKNKNCFRRSQLVINTGLCCCCFSQMHKTMARTGTLTNVTVFQSDPTSSNKHCSSWMF